MVAGNARTQQYAETRQKRNASLIVAMQKEITEPTRSTLQYDRDKWMRGWEWKGSEMTFRLNYKVQSGSFVLSAAIKTNVFWYITVHLRLFPLASCPIKHRNKSALIKSVFLWSDTRFLLNSAFATVSSMTPRVRSAAAWHFKGISVRLSVTHLKKKNDCGAFRGLMRD